MTDASIAALAGAAQTRHVLVVGGGVAGLVAALECAEVGLRVTIAEESPVFGGTLGSAALDGVAVDLGPEGFSRRGGAVRALAERLGLTVVRSAPLSTWIAGSGRIAAPLPAASLLGIPENPWADEVRRLIGWRGAWRAYLDRLRPPLTIGQQRSLGALVRSRMGERVRERLVAPLSIGTYGVHPDDIDVEVAAPGLSTALTRTGSLAGAVAQLRAGDAAPHVLESIDGGMALLVDALSARLAELGADLRPRTRVAALAPTSDGGWRADLEPMDPDAEASALTSDAVIVATPEIDARALLATHVPVLDAEVERPTTVEVVTLVVDADGLGTRPRGDAVFSVPGTHRATGVVVSSARWAHLSAALPAGRHVLRVSFGTAADAPATEALDAQDAERLARSEAEALLGVALHVVASRRDRYTAALPASARGHRDAAHAVRGAVTAVSGLGIVGGWIAGSGLAQVVPDAVAEADRVRRALLWGGRTTAR